MARAIPYLGMSQRPVGRLLALAAAVHSDPSGWIGLPGRSQVSHVLCTESKLASATLGLRTWGFRPAPQAGAPQFSLGLAFELLREHTLFP